MTEIVFNHINTSVYGIMMCKLLITVVFNKIVDTTKYVLLISNYAEVYRISRRKLMPSVTSQQTERLLEKCFINIL